MENGRMVLPASIRKRLGLEKGGTVIVELGEEAEATLRSVEQVLYKVKATLLGTAIVRAVRSMTFSPTG